MVARALCSVRGARQHSACRRASRGRSHPLAVQGIHTGAGSAGCGAGVARTGAVAESAPLPPLCDSCQAWHNDDEEESYYQLTISKTEGFQTPEESSPEMSNGGGDMILAPTFAIMFTYSDSLSFDTGARGLRGLQAG